MHETLYRYPALDICLSSLSLSVSIILYLSLSPPLPVTAPDFSLSS